MAAEISTPPATTPTAEPNYKELLSKLDFAKAKSQLEQVKAFYQQFAGKIGCNPYFYLYKAVFPKEAELNNFEGQVFATLAEKYKAASKLLKEIDELEQKESLGIIDKQAYLAEIEGQKALAAAKLNPKQMTAGQMIGKVA